MKLLFAAVALACLGGSTTQADSNGIRRLQNCDRDGDGFLAANSKCGGTDCDDRDAAVNPAAVEVCGNGNDDNCDGQIDEDCAPTSNGVCAGTTISCIFDADCPGVCDAKADNTGDACSIDDNCPPNGGKPAFRGSCVASVGACVNTPPTPTTSPTTSPTQAPTNPAPTDAPTTQAPTAPPTTSPTQAPTNPAPTDAPTTSPTQAPTPTSSATYFPGELTVSCEGLTLSTGMSCARLTSRNQRVQFTDGSGGQSSDTFHLDADGAGVIADKDPSNPGGWYYTSNAEESGTSGGVGSIRFNSQGQVIGYERNLASGRNNCGGGLTWWDTWVTCEESGTSGRVYEVDPYTGYTAQTLAVPYGGNFESFAFDRELDLGASGTPRFFITEDKSTGPLIRYTPVASAFNTGNNYDILTTPGGTHEYLILNGDASGTFTWTSDVSAARSNASNRYPQAEGIDVFDGILFFVIKGRKQLFELDLRAGTFIRTSTVSGAFNLQPDQLGRVIGSEDILYFCEDGGSDCDIHGRDSTGQYFTIVEGTSFSTETTGLAFSPDAKFMYVSFQGPSAIFAFWRDDGLPFSGTVAGTKYH